MYVRSEGDNLQYNKKIAYFSHIAYVFKAMSMIFFPNLVTIAQFKGFLQSVYPCTYTPGLNLLLLWETNVGFDSTLEYFKVWKRLKQSL